MTKRKCDHTKASGGTMRCKGCGRCFWCGVVVPEAALGESASPVNDALRERAALAALKKLTDLCSRRNLDNGFTLESQLTRECIAEKLADAVLSALGESARSEGEVTHE